MISPYAPRPVRHPVMFQQWDLLTFLHWSFDSNLIRALLPVSLTLDTYDNRAWVGLTPFLLTHLRPPFLPAVPWLSAFPETNVRTYVRGPDGEAGIWFFTLEADRLLAVLGARVSYALPYRWAHMSVKASGDIVQYRSRRNRVFGAGKSDIVIEPGTAMLPGDFDNFLTARYRLYSILAGRLAFADIEHDPWPLQNARLVGVSHNLFEQSGVPRASGDPTLHFSRTLTVRIGRLHWAVK